MSCPSCQSQQIRKYGFKKGKQRHQCKSCGRIFQSTYSYRAYSDDARRICLNMYLNGMGFRAIERVSGVHHTTVINWVKESAEDLSESKEEDAPTVAELDELQTYVGNKNNKIWIWTAINHYCSGLLAMTIGDRSEESFEKLHKRVKDWKSRKYITDGYCVYAHQLDPEQHLVLPKTQMTRIEGKNTRLRHYLARLHRQTLCYSKSVEMLWYSVRLLMHYLRFKTLPIPA